MIAVFLSARSSEVLRCRSCSSLIRLTRYCPINVPAVPITTPISGNAGFSMLDDSMR
jgi:hypothetical protein